MRESTLDIVNRQYESTWTKEDTRDIPMPDGVPYPAMPDINSDFIWDFWKLYFPSHLGKYIIKIGKISTKIHEIGKIMAIFGLGMTPIYV